MLHLLISDFEFGSDIGIFEFLLLDSGLVGFLETPHLVIQEFLKIIHY